MELGIPMVLALNMMDEVEGNGCMIRINEMERLLGIPVIPISAMKNEGVNELVEHALHVAKYEERPARQDFCSPNEHGGAVHRCLHAIMHFIEDHAERANIPLRFASSKLVEGDQLVVKALGLTTNEMETIEHILTQMEEERGLDRCAAMADMRFYYIREVCKRTLVYPSQSKEYLRSQRIDRILTGKWTAIPTFILIMGLVFYLTFDSLGAWLQNSFSEAIDWFTEISDKTLTSWDIAPVVHSLIIDGIYSGVGTVLSFLPLIVVLFFFLSMLEDTGYMARIAFVMDRPMRRLGLSGRSIVSLLIGFGCSVPSVMSSRTLPSERDRKLTIMLTPFMSCTAKIPIYAFFSAAFFPEKAGLVMVSLYVLGILVGILTAIIMKHSLFRGKAVPFVMELPNYRLPIANNVLRLLWDKAKDFLQRAFTVIFLASIIIWFLRTFDFHLNMIQEGMENHSILAQIANMIAPVFSPMGYGDWRVVSALVSGVLAKEVVVAVMSSLFNGIAIAEVMSAATAYALLVFCLLYTPCMAAMATIRRELGTKWMFFIMIFQCVIAWIVSFLISIIL
ncbi:MAG: ferrous iron transport protein B, partial [Bacteroidaceae bacterium]|nr:ferrous iron transport protein B [Bacteroidaceae bacterium]